MMILSKLAKTENHNEDDKMWCDVKMILLMIYGDKSYDDDNDDGNDDEIMMVDSRLGGGSVMNVTLVQTWKSKRNWVRFWFNFFGSEN